MPNDNENNDNDIYYTTDYINILERNFGIELPDIIDAWYDTQYSDYRIYNREDAHIYSYIHSYIKERIEDIWNRGERCFVTLKDERIQIGFKSYDCKYIEIISIHEIGDGNYILYGRFNDKDIIIPMNKVCSIIEGGI